MHSLIASIQPNPILQVLRNVSNWTYNAQMEIAEAGQDPNTHYQQRGMWGRFVGQLFGMLNDPRGGGRDEVLLVELVGTLNNLTVFDLPRTTQHPNPKWSRFVREYDLISFIGTFL